jgi:hypothetical protein
MRKVVKFYTKYYKDKIIEFCKEEKDLKFLFELAQNDLQKLILNKYSE